MTGFGTADGDIGPAHASVEIRSVNHRFFSPSIKLPSVLSRWEAEVRETVRARISRGYVSVTVRLDSRTGPSAAIDDAAFAKSVERLRALRERHVLGGDIDVATVLRVPGVVIGAEDNPPVESPDQLLNVVGAAADALVRSREAEGGRLGEFVRERLALVEAAIGRIATRAPARITAHRDKLRANVREIAGGVAVDEQRLAQEVAVLAERLDIGEELDRFCSHLAAFRATLAAATSEPVGKRLGFLLQEMLREANTSGSTANDAAMQQDVVALKEELEQIREQVENLE
jgi:uncharacterized protein (TIGR00255 family)